jgi:hypothetical protein
MTCTAHTDAWSSIELLPLDNAVARWGLKIPGKTTGTKERVTECSPCHQCELTLAKKNRREIYHYAHRISRTTGRRDDGDAMKRASRPPNHFVFEP